MTALYPNQIHTFHEFYLWKDTNEYVCGIKIHADLQLFARDNGIDMVTREAFAVYNTEYGSLAPRINLYCPPLKFAQNDNTIITFLIIIKKEAL